MCAEDILDGHTPINSQAQERLGYPTQKPEALLERILKASSNEGDLVLDPFCGCGTTVQVAQRLNRRWIGIDITHLAIGLIKKRLSDAFGPEIKSTYEVIGEPTDYEGAAALAAEDKYQFQWWALGQVGARPAEQKKGADRGIDGRLYFHDDDSGQSKQIVFSVKAGGVSVPQVRDLVGVLDREKAEIGVFLCFEEPTKPMLNEAAEAGFYKSHRRHHLPQAANPHHPADSRRQAARVPAPPPRCDLQESSAQPPRRSRKPDPAAAAAGVNYREGGRGPQRRVLVAGVEEGGFNPRIKPAELTGALAPEGIYPVRKQLCRDS